MSRERFPITEKPSMTNGWRECNWQRAQLLFDQGAIAKSALENFEDAEQDAKVTLETAQEHLNLLGVDKDHPTGLVSIHAPVSGVITDQQVTNAAGVQGLSVRIRSPSRTYPMFGFSATCTKTLYPRFMLATPPTFI